MKVKSASYIGSAVKRDQYPTEGKPEVAFVGRSNVGKSSLINNLVNRRGLVKTSGKPGKTRTINFFDVNGVLNMVDLPGYGYAAVSKGMKEEWGGFIEGYLREREELRLVIQLVDIRHEPTVLDIQMYSWLQSSGVPYLLVATKADKIAKGKRINHITSIRKKLMLPSNYKVIAFSSVNGEGKADIWQVIMDNIEPPSI
jgi:GTP-binding protein